eukprot:jgi/Botrbrau1/24/Bobra.0022s0020.1
MIASFTVLSLLKLYLASLQGYSRLYLFFLGSRAWDDCSLRLGYCFGGTYNDHSIRTHNTLSGRGPDRRQILWQTFYNHTFWKLTVTVRGRHPSLYTTGAFMSVPA